MGSIVTPLGFSFDPKETSMKRPALSGVKTPQKLEFFEIRHKDGQTVKVPNYTRKTAIKCMCSECMGFESDVRGCTDTRCPLYPFRANTVINRNRSAQDADQEETDSED